jgi:photosystem II stability/assembly factor-like uncharacterized protein
MQSGRFFFIWNTILTLISFLTASSQGPTWMLVPGTGNHGTSAIAIYGRNPDTMYAVGLRKFVISTNGGRSWDSVSPYRAANGAMAVDPQDSRHVYLAHDGVSPGGTDVSQSTDAGRTWTRVVLGHAPPAAIVEVDPVDNSTVYLGAGPNILYRTTDRGGTWSLIAMPQGTLVSLAIAGTNDSVLYAGYFAGVFKSSDKGATWSSLSLGIPLLHTVGVRVDPRDENVVYARVYLQGVFKSTSGGTQWVQIDSTIPSTQNRYQTMIINQKTPDELFIGTNANGDILFRSFNAGLAWEPYSNGLPDFEATLMSIAMDTIHNRMFVGTYGDPGLQGIYTNDPTIVNVAESGQEFGTSLIIHQNYPNPFNPATTIEFLLPEAAAVHLRVYDVLGRQVATVAEGARAAGTHRVTWDAAGLAGGVYFGRLQVDGGVCTIKMLLTK